MSALLRVIWAMVAYYGIDLYAAQTIVEKTQRQQKLRLNKSFNHRKRYDYKRMYGYEYYTKTKVAKRRDFPTVSDFCMGDDDSTWRPDMTTKKKNRERERNLQAQLSQPKQAQSQAPVIIDTVPVEALVPFGNPSTEELRMGDPAGGRWYSSGRRGHKATR